MGAIFFFLNIAQDIASPSTFMAPSRKRKRDLNDKSHTFLVSLEPPQFSSVGPVAVIDKVSADYRRALPQKHTVRLPTPPLPPFFDDFAFGDDEAGIGKATLGELCIQTTDFAADAIKDHRKVHASSVSQVAFFEFIRLIFII